MAYLCKTVDETTKACLEWVQFDLSGLAITGWQSSLIIMAITSYYLVMWLLRQSRYSIK
ncbi:hypothetical protein [Acinetobacter sp. FL]|jgi:hypothetical protein|uniref:hypothetical protein n=1 Tax=Acinetobacter sp. FL TaxID=3231720 RepID=UPI00345C3DA4